MCVISVISKIKPHAYYKTHFHTTKVITILIPSFQFGEDQPKKPPAFLESHYAKASLTNKGLDWMVNLKTILCQRLTPSSSFSIIYCFSSWLTKEQQQKYLLHEVHKNNLCWASIMAKGSRYIYSRLSLNRHLYKTDTSVKQTLRVGPCLSLLPLFDSL